MGLSDSCWLDLVNIEKVFFGEDGVAFTLRFNGCALIFQGLVW